MARQIQRYEVTPIGEVCPSDKGRWCLWEDVAPYIVVENGSSHNQPLNAIALLHRCLGALRKAETDGQLRSDISEYLMVGEAQQQ